jgi:hypothetical protein
MNDLINTRKMIELARADLAEVFKECEVIADRIRELQKCERNLEKEIRDASTTT